VAPSRLADKRKTKRFHMDSPVTVAILSPRNGGGTARGQLRDIGLRGARFQLEHPLLLGAHVLLHVHFSNSNERVTTIRFEGVVKRVHRRPPYEIVVQFRRRGRFLRGRLGELFQKSSKRLP